MANEYKVLISWADLENGTENTSGITAPIEAEQKTSTVNKAPTTKQSINNSNDMMKGLRNATAVYAFARQGSQMLVNMKATNYEIRGESLKAERMQTSFSNTTNNIGLGLAAGASIVTLNPIVISMTAYTLAQRAINLGIENKKYVAQVSSELYKSQYYQNRLVKDISEVR